MKIVVQKYGGTSLASPRHVKRIADQVIATKNKGFAVVVVVSALGYTTDHLQDLANQITSTPSPRELDMLLSVGERVSIALLAMAIQARGYPAISFTGSQVGIITSTDHTRARILEIRGDRMLKELLNGKIVVVAGYQGVSVDKEITTLGRGGSDTTAVALAAALDAERCEIMSDVNGVYTANPRIIDEARILPEISYDEMLDMADMGAQVMKASAVEFAKRHRIKIHVGSSFTGEIGTIITDSPLDRNRVTAVTSDDQVILLQIAGFRNGVIPDIMRCLAHNGVTLKATLEDEHRYAILVKQEDLQATRHLIEQARNGHHFSVREQDDIGLLSITGVGINFGTNIMAMTLDIFSRLGVTPTLFSFSETKLLFSLPRTRLKEAATEIHKALIT